MLKLYGGLRTYRMWYTSIAMTGLTIATPGGPTRPLKLHTADFYTTLPVSELWVLKGLLKPSSKIYRCLHGEDRELS